MFSISKPPQGATHIRISSGYREAGGNYAYRIEFYKQEGGNWLIFKSDTDNEYPGWDSAPYHFKNFNKVIEQLHEIPDVLFSV